ncbi:MAG: hypothetical protein D6724_08810 [Armatimonadetes bacterium]|nr:MAG: hypothetical protein D6724_08810 [Armatimonadota bacterium]
MTNDEVHASAGREIREWAERAYDFLEQLDDALAVCAHPSNRLQAEKIAAELRALMGDFPYVDQQATGGA